MIHHVLNLLSIKISVFKFCNYDCNKSYRFIILFGQAAFPPTMFDGPQIYYLSNSHLFWYQKTNLGIACLSFINNKSHELYNTRYLSLLSPSIVGLFTVSQFCTHYIDKQELFHRTNWNNVTKPRQHWNILPFLIKLSFILSILRRADSFFFYPCAISIFKKHNYLIHANWCLTRLLQFILHYVLHWTHCSSINLLYLIVYVTSWGDL